MATASLERGDLLTCSQAAEILGYSRSDTFRRWANRARFPLVRLSCRTVYVRRLDLEAEVRNRATAAGTWEQGEAAVDALVRRLRGMGHVPRGT